jgi:hypothetical protein
LAVELDVSLKSYLPDGRLIDLGPETSNIGDAGTPHCIFRNLGTGIAINGPQVIVKQTFGKDPAVRICGKMFRDCKFEGTTLIFDGSAPATFASCDTPQFRFQFEGAALNTIEFLRALHGGGPGARQFVESVIATISNEPSSKKSS